MTTREPPQHLQAKRARADELRAAIVSDLRALRREVAGMMPRVTPVGQAGFPLSARRIPGWAVAAAAGVVAGVAAALRRRRARQP